MTMENKQTTFLEKFKITILDKNSTLPLHKKGHLYKISSTIELEQYNVITNYNYHEFQFLVRKTENETLLELIDCIKKDRLLPDDIFNDNQEFHKFYTVISL